MTSDLSDRLYEVANSDRTKKNHSKGIASQVCKIRPLGRNYGIYYLDEYVTRKNVPAPAPELVSAPASAGHVFSKAELERFIMAFDKSGESDDPAVSASYYAPMVLNYFGRRNVSRAFIQRDRAEYIQKWTGRSYTPQRYDVLSISDTGCTVAYVSNFVLSNSKKTLRGRAITTMELQRTAGGFTIRAIDQTIQKLLPGLH